MSTLFSCPSKNQRNAQGAVTENPGMTLVSNIINYINDKYVVFNKSGMLAEDEHSAGRPYGGVAIICRVIDGLTYELVKCASDNSRIVAVLIKDIHDNPVHLIICLYMPYYDGSKPMQTDDYLTCIDATQSIIDTYGDIVPIKIVGDFNVQLPKSKPSHNWFKSKGFNVHCRILHDFIVGNNLTVVDHVFNQSVKYTYFNIPRNINTWIDHIISTEYDMGNIDMCKIIELDVGNVSETSCSYLEYQETHHTIVCEMKSFNL